MATLTHYCYDGQTTVRELRQDGQGAWTAAATYLPGPRGMEYRRDDDTGVVKWYVYDGLGSVVGELDPSGNLTAEKKYDVYGAERQGRSLLPGRSLAGPARVGGARADAEPGVTWCSPWAPPRSSRPISANNRGWTDCPSLCHNTSRHLFQKSMA